MENNKILIGVQFTYYDNNLKKPDHLNIELYTLRDITFYQLCEGIKYGLKKKLNEENLTHKNIYYKCNSVFQNTYENIAVDSNNITYFKNITLASYDKSVINDEYKSGQRYIFKTSDTHKTLCDLGFITSTKLIFDETGVYNPMGEIDISSVVDAFKPQNDTKIQYPEYNRSTRIIYQFDKTPVDIISPTDPPHKPDNSLLSMLLPSLFSILGLALVRAVMSSFGSGSGLYMILLSVAMVPITALSTFFLWKRQQKNYADSLKSWRNRYQNYIDKTMFDIRTRQQSETKKLKDMYPDVSTLIKSKENGVYSLNENIYSRSSRDEDFLSFRVGVSDDVESLFAINSENKNVVFSESKFDIVQDNNGNNRVRIRLKEELTENEHHMQDLCHLPFEVSKQYRYLKNAPLLYSLKNKGALGVVDYRVDQVISAAHYFLSRMIFELCYYHSPDDLQFIVFFKEENNWKKIEHEINRYKFMPHFHGLFSDKSQFVFDAQSANLVMSNLLTLMRRREEMSAEDANIKTPHIVFIVYDWYGLKEHAFAEYLPKVPESGNAFYNKLGLTFVFAEKYKEHLPHYCDDIVTFTGKEYSITPRNNQSAKKTFEFGDSFNISKNIQNSSGWSDFIRESTRTMRFLSAIHYSRIAQSGKVPSSVTSFDLIPEPLEKLPEYITDLWENKSKYKKNKVTKSLSVPVGKTDSDTAYIDLHEKADGPHMLVAGTTGSGKTETIISYLIELCMRFSPKEVNLLLVDMKGGGFTKRLGMLPHVVGSVTDVDGDENGTGSEYMLRRFLFAMKAEIKRRKILFNKFKVDSIDSFISACDDIESHIVEKNIPEKDKEEIRRIAEEKLSHLFLVVDEFTELKRFSSENNDIDFIGEITTIARIGRSLGFHIILISQNIEGAITDDIRVNSNARLCLKVATRQASKDMLGTDLAASPTMPGLGRAYFMVGTGSKFEYFQSAYSGTIYSESDYYSDLPVELTLASKSGVYSSFYSSVKDNKKIIEIRETQKKNGKSKTQLDIITNKLAEAFKSTGAKAPHQVFQPPLPKTISFENGHIIDLADERG